MLSYEVPKGSWFYKSCFNTTLSHSLHIVSLPKSVLLRVCLPSLMCKKSITQNTKHYFSLFYAFPFPQLNAFKSLLYIGYASTLHQAMYLGTPTALAPLRSSGLCPNHPCKMHMLSLASSSKVWKCCGNPYTTGNHQGHLVTCQPQRACLTASCIVNQKYTYLVLASQNKHTRQLQSIQSLVHPAGQKKKD